MTDDWLKFIIPISHKKIIIFHMTKYCTNLMQYRPSTYMKYYSMIVIQYFFSSEAIFWNTQ